MKKLALLTLAAMPLTFAWAESAGRFGDAGTLSPSGTIAGAYATNTPSHEASILFAPTLFYFVLDGFAVGGGVGFLYSKNPDGSIMTSYSVAPAIGYNLHLSNRFSLFPNARLGFSWYTGAGLLNNTSSQLLIEAPLLAHFGNFFVGAGPYLGPPAATLGFTTVTGGWF
jgi:hypothetical protein